MSAERLFMITVAAVLGLSALVAAIHNHDVYYRLPKARLMRSSAAPEGLPSPPRFAK